MVTHNRSYSTYRRCCFRLTMFAGSGLARRHPCSSPCALMHKLFAWLFYLFLMAIPLLWCWLCTVHSWWSKAVKGREIDIVKGQESVMIRAPNYNGVKLMVLGTSDASKKTLLAQLNILYGIEPTEEERCVAARVYQA